MMALLLRVVTKPKWVRPDWMNAEDVPADALTDLRATDNRLSVWIVTGDRSNLDPVLVAAASNRERIDKLDYALLDEQVLPTIGIDCVNSEGDTPHDAANRTMHRDLIELTVRKVAALAHTIMPLERSRVSERQVRGMLIGALRDGILDRSRMSDKLLNQLESPG